MFVSASVVQSVRHEISSVWNFLDWRSIVDIPRKIFTRHANCCKSVHNYMKNIGCTYEDPHNCMVDYVSSE